MRTFAIKQKDKGKRREIPEKKKNIVDVSVAKVFLQESVSLRKRFNKVNGWNH